MIKVAGDVAMQFVKDRVRDDARKGVGPFGTSKNASVREDRVRTPPIPPEDPWGKVEEKVKGQDVERLPCLAGKIDEVFDIDAIIEFPASQKNPKVRPPARMWTSSCRRLRRAAWRADEPFTASSQKAMNADSQGAACGLLIAAQTT